MCNCSTCQDAVQLHDITDKIKGLGAKARHLHDKIRHSKNSCDDKEYKCDKWKQHFDSDDESDRSEYEASCKKEVKEEAEKGHTDHSKSSNNEVCKKEDLQKAQKNRNAHKDDVLVKGSASHASKNAESGEKKRRTMRIVKHYEKEYCIDDEKENRKDEDCDNHKDHDHKLKYDEEESCSEKETGKAFRSKESDSESDSCSEKRGNLVKEQRGKKSGKDVKKVHRKHKVDDGHVKRNNAHHKSSCEDKECRNKDCKSKHSHSEKHRRPQKKIVYRRDSCSSDSSSSDSCSSGPSFRCKSKRGTCRR